MWPANTTQLFQQISSWDLKISLSLTIFLCIAFSYPAIKRKWLNPAAMSATSLIATILVYKAGLPILIFPFLFALVGSLISNKDSAKEKKGRTVRQVLANAGVAIIFILLISDLQYSIPIVIFVFAIAMSDTMSSELGKKFAGPTYDICTFQKMPPGLSGGVSVLGTASGLLGSTLIACTSLLYSFDLSFFLWVILIGFTGMLIDSILGSIAQGKYQSAKIISEEGEKSNLVKGFHWMNNDLVNFLSILFTISLILLAS